MSLKPGFLSPKEPDRISYENQLAVPLLTESITALLPKLGYKPIVILCIGTDRSTGDSLGPLVGAKLNRQLSQFPVYGTLKDPVHAVNLEDTIEYINKKHKFPYIIAIDACLGKLNSVGTFLASPGPLRPGAGVNKILPEVGSMHITGIVNVSGFMEYFVLQNTRLHLVMAMADIIAESIKEAESIYIARRASQKKKWLSEISIVTRSTDIEQSQST
ncbi:spore protease YyaC [Bacillus lacus]|uniref:Spore protease YyaC n=1 Tax=Metabacillus lacus TaxID=1983721 RepID=A0A7X2J0W9_9BACI|nr:spore protease YyaC [Metabacillus lacus]MRX73395.1 spore protease YyaC [Metabacillus lacus]